LRALPVDLVTHNTGSIDSMATVIFLAGSKRFAAKHSAFLFHGVAWNFAPGVPVSFTRPQEVVSRFKGEEARMAGIIAERTKRTEEEIRSLLAQGESKDVTFA